MKFNKNCSTEFNEASNGYPSTWSPFLTSGKYIDSRITEKVARPASEITF